MQCPLTVLTIFRTPCCPCVLIIFGNDSLHVDKELRIEKKERDNPVNPYPTTFPYGNGIVANGCKAQVALRPFKFDAAI